MPGQADRMSPLATRKRLLLAESDINRVRLADDLLVVSRSVGAFTDRAGSYGRIASSVVGLVAGLAAATAPKTEVKQGWLQTAISGAGLLSSLWGAFRHR
jgi:hypothetical protein